MSVYLTPVTFENQFITPSDDGAAWAACMTDGISAGCALSLAGTTLTLAAGKIVAAGRTARVDAAKTFSISNNYSRLVLTIDLSKTAAEQVALDIESASAISGFSALTQNNVNNGGQKYQFVVCLCSSSAILWKCGAAHSKGYGVQVPLPAAGWSNHQQTVYVDGVTADANAIVTYDPSSKAAWEAAGIYASAQGDGTITFTCTTDPSVAVNANVLLY